MGAKSLISLFRLLNPTLLSKKDRGKGIEGRELLAYGEEQPASGIDGIDLLEDYKKQQELLGENFHEEPIDLVSDDDDEGWIDVSSDEDKGEKLPESDSWAGWEEVGEDDNTDDEIDDTDDNTDGDDDAKSNNNIDDDTLDNCSDSQCKMDIGKEMNTEDQSNKELERGDDKTDEQDNHNIVKNNIVEKDSRQVEEVRTNRLDVLQILTPEDFERIQYLKLKKDVDGKTGSKRKKPGVDEVDVTTIEAGIKKRKMNYDERMECIKAGSEGREKFGSKRGKKDKTSSVGLTNREKEKKKPYGLTKMKRRNREKKTRSLHQNLSKKQLASKKAKRKKR